jgi:hypothetical protein
MRLPIYFSLFFSTFLIPNLVQSQTFGNVCKDSLQANLNPCFGTPFQPVCGCDGVTYRNECGALAKGVLLWGQGPCEALDFDIVPNPMVDIGNFFIITKSTSDVQVWIYDIFAKNKYYFRYPQVYMQTMFQANIDVRGFGNGIYFAVLETNGFFKVKKILINQIN